MRAVGVKLCLYTSKGKASKALDRHFAASLLAYTDGYASADTVRAVSKLCHDAAVGHYNSAKFAEAAPLFVRACTLLEEWYVHACPCAVSSSNDCTSMVVLHKICNAVATRSQPCTSLRVSATQGSPQRPRVR